MIPGQLKESLVLGLAIACSDACDRQSITSDPAPIVKGVVIAPQLQTQSSPRVPPSPTNTGSAGDSVVRERLALALQRGHRLSVGGLQTCAIVEDGSVACIGVRQILIHDERTPNTLLVRTTPEPIAGVPRAMLAVSVGGEHACALSQDGKVYCWGLGEDGQLGAGPEHRWSDVALEVEGLPAKAIAISAGDRHSCAVLRDGRVSCWGSGRRGELGNGAEQNSHGPVSVALRGHAGPMISGSGSHTCAGSIGGDTICWGRGDDRGLGFYPIGVHLSPRVVPSLMGVVQLAVGTVHACAVHAEGGVSCWGDGYIGQLGNRRATGDREPRTNATAHHPVAAKILKQPVQQVAVVDHGSTCALFRSGELQCWGDNFHGQLGNGTNTHSLRPVQVRLPASEHAVALSGGYGTICVATATRRVWCWGYGRAFGLREDSLRPQEVPGLRLVSLGPKTDPTGGAQNRSLAPPISDE